MIFIKNRTKEIFSHLYSFIYHTKTVAKVATKPKVLVALAIVSVAISSTGLLKLECSYAQHQTPQLTWKSGMK